MNASADSDGRTAPEAGVVLDAAPPSPLPLEDQAQTVRDPQRASFLSTRDVLAGRVGWLVLALTVGVGVVAWSAQHRVGRVEQELVRRMQSMELQLQQTDKHHQVVADTLRDTQAKVALLEAKLADSLEQQAQLRLLYDQMARTRSDQMFADAENAVLIAAQQLQWGGHVQTALLALQDADQALARANLPATIGVRRVLARDIERLKALPWTDLGSAVAGLDGLLDELADLPLVAAIESRRDKRKTPLATAADQKTTWSAMPLGERVARTGALGWDAVLTELRQLVRVQRVEQPEALLLSADQRVLVREMVRLQIMNARLNLLARHQALFRSDVGRVLRSVQQWFDPRDDRVQRALATLRPLQTLPVAIELPSLQESLQALRAARAAALGSR